MRRPALLSAEVLAIGDELTSGQRLDTNSQWMSQRLGEIGIEVKFHSTVNDDLAAIQEVIGIAMRRVDIVLVTGGLGPTADDLTRDALAKVMQVPLELDETMLEHIKLMFSKRGREMPERNQVQAMFPKGTFPIPNPEGTAPGIHATVPREAGAKAGQCSLFFFPGVPAEMKQMWEATVLPELLRLSGAPGVIAHRVFKCFGIGESHLEQMLPDLIKRGRQPSVGITVHEATISLRVTSQAENLERSLELMQPTIETIRECLGELVFGEEQEDLQHVVLKLLQAKNQTLSTVEGKSGGLLKHWLGEVTDIEDTYYGGITIPNARSFQALFAKESQVNPESEDAVKQMAQLGRELMQTDYTLATSGFPNVLSTTDTPIFYIAIAGADMLESIAFDYVGHSAIVKSRAGKQALNFLRLHLLKQD